MIGDVKNKVSINGTVIPSASIAGKVSGSCTTGTISIGKLGIVRCYHGKYTGYYTVIPSVSGEVLETNGKVLKDDITVRPIPYYVTSNLSGGYTVNIGG